MKDRFLELWSRMNAKGNGDLEFDRLAAMYSEPTRFYHNLAHVTNCLDELHMARHLVRNPEQIEMAIWYHDAIYDTKAKDSEEQSAELARSVCLGASLPTEFASEVRELILATKHNGVPNSIDAKLLVDADLSILGKPGKVFDTYEENIRKEYSWVPEDQFKQGRSTILQMFLNRPSLYTTDLFKRKYESQAIINLKRSIDSLSPMID